MGGAACLRMTDAPIFITASELLERNKSTAELKKKADEWLKFRGIPSWQHLFTDLEVTDDFAQEYVELLIFTHGSTPGMLEHRAWGHVLDAARMADRADYCKLNQEKFATKKKREVGHTLGFKRTPTGKYETVWWEIERSEKDWRNLENHWERQFNRADTQGMYFFMVTKLLFEHLGITKPPGG